MLIVGIIITIILIVALIILAIRTTEEPNKPAKILIIIIPVIIGLTGVTVIEVSSKLKKDRDSSTYEEQNDTDNSIHDVTEIVTTITTSSVYSETTTHSETTTKSSTTTITTEEDVEIITSDTKQKPKVSFLADMELFANGSDGYKPNKYLVDNYRNTYQSSISVESGYVSYLIKDLGFKHFVGTVALPKDVNPDAFYTSAQLEIYIDNVLAYRSDNITSESKPEHFDLDISSAEVIKLSWTCSGANLWNNWCYFATVFDAYCSDEAYFPEVNLNNSIAQSDKEVVNIADEDLFATSSDRLYINEYLVNNYNEEFLTSFSVDQGYASFLVKGRGFSKFTGTIALPNDITPDNYRSSAQLEILVDEEIAFRSSEFTSESKPQSFDIDITDAEVVKISWTCSGANLWNNWCYFATIFDGKFSK